MDKEIFKKDIQPLIDKDKMEIKDLLFATLSDVDNSFQKSEIRKTIIS